jgi:hypothetical protein
MRASLHRRLVLLEQAVQYRQARAQPAPSGHLEMFQEWLRVWGIEQQLDESPAMAICRAMGISGPELRHRLMVRACP